MTDVMILAAGLGTRMKSRRAKVLHELAGLPLVAHVLRASFQLAPETIFTIVGHQGAEVEQAVREQAAALRATGQKASADLQFVSQTEQKGTGHAVMAARDRLAKRSGSLVLLAGDVPLISGETLKILAGVHEAENNEVTMLTVIMDDPTGYGRIIRDSANRFVRLCGAKRCFRGRTAGS
jgi:bifunctional UDP-N-acetylglucosamine pyrophosphorylase/glucosamine-1-phosphate N-acetyltransferase